MCEYRWSLNGVDLYIQSAELPDRGADAWNGDSGKAGGNTAEVQLLHAVDLTIKPGEWLFLVGANGSGKSSLARLLAGFGSCRVDGSYREYVGAAVAGSFAITEAEARFAPLVSQNPESALVGMTPAEDAMLLLEQLALPSGEIGERIDRALRVTGLASLRDEPIARLSGGQKQLAAIAGCIASGADAIILDEPTAMLDPEASAAVMQAARALHRDGTAVVWVTQRLEELLEGDRVVALKNGCILYDGEAETFFSRGGKAMPGPSPCELTGLEPPYIVKAVWALQESGIRLSPRMPLSAASLAKAVSGYGG